MPKLHRALLSLLTSFAVFAALGAALSIAHAADIEGSSDHPLVRRQDHEMDSGHNTRRVVVERSRSDTFPNKG